MRANYILLAAVALLTACSSDAETTAPLSPVSVATATAVSDAETAGQPTTSARKAPVVITVEGPNKMLDPFFSKTEQTFAVCPTGSVVVGGGYRIESGLPDLKISESHPVGATAWGIVGVSNSSAGFRAIARCLEQ